MSEKSDPWPRGKPKRAGKACNRSRRGPSLCPPISPPIGRLIWGLFFLIRLYNVGIYRDLTYDLSPRLTSYIHITNYRMRYRTHYRPHRRTHDRTACRTHHRTHYRTYIRSHCRSHYRTHYRARIRKHNRTNRAKREKQVHSPSNSLSSIARSANICSLTIAFHRQLRDARDDLVFTNHRGQRRTRASVGQSQRGTSAGQSQEEKKQQKKFFSQGLA